MKTSREQNFERELPTGYKRAVHIDAKNAKFGIIFNLIGILIWVIVVVGAIFSLRFNNEFASGDYEIGESFYLAYAVLGVYFIYIILHELAHGIAYKMLTGEKLTFGISWSCAFCGVPKIYTYRKTALVAVMAPFVLFTLLSIPLLIFLYYFDPIYYLAAAALFGLHFGGCSGDLYIFILLTTKFKNNKTLMHDTGPEMSLYVTEE